MHKLGSILATALALTGGSAIGVAAFRSQNLSGTGPQREQEWRPDATPLEKSVQAKRDNAFGLALVQQLTADLPPNNNLIVSTYSASEALSYTRAATAGATASELDSALAGKGFEVDHNARKQLRQQLMRDGKSLKINNSLWVDQNLQIQKNFASIGKDLYDSSARKTDFANSNRAASDINSWVNDKTKGDIKNLVKPSDFSARTEAVLVNTVRFKGKWSNRFESDKTTEHQFQTGAKSVMVPMMESKVRAVSRDGVMLVSLTYETDYRMLIALPQDSTRDTLDGAFASLFGPEQGRAGSECNTTLLIPKWEARSKINLVDPLKTLGVRAMFTEGAEIPGIGPAIYVDKVIQEAVIKVDESGTVASAATAVTFNNVSSTLPPLACPTVLRLDHPFAYVIEHESTGEIVFAGQLGDPSVR